MKTSFFELLVPAQKRSSPAVGRGAAMTVPSLRVLVVEDNPVNRAVVCQMLSKRGHVVVAVNDGVEGVAEWQKGHCDIILMDMEMPFLDGPSATRRIRAEEKILGGHIPIIALTANAAKGTEEECLAHGMDGYIAKPWQRDSFLEVVEAMASATDKSHAALKAKPANQPALAAKSILTETTEFVSPLIRLEKVAVLVGHDRELQQKVLNLCAEALAAKVPQMNRAMNKGDRATVQSIVHYLRGSLGMLGLPSLVQIGEDIECRYEVLGKEAWQQRCEEFRKLLRRIEEELRQLQAA